MSEIKNLQIPNVVASKLPVAIIGAGPVGLAAAAHALEEGLKPVIFESGSGVGDNISSWGHIRLFSPWRYNIDKSAERLLVKSGWQTPDLDSLPTGHEIVEQYLKPLSQLPEMNAHLNLGAEVLSVTRKGRDKVISEGRDERPFVLRVRFADDRFADIEASAVIDASGTWKNPNPLGAGGVPAIGELENKERIVYGIPDILGQDRIKYIGKRTLVVGAGHSAANALLDLAALAEQEKNTEIIWAIRGSNLSRVFGGGENDQLPARGELGDRLKALTECGTLKLYTNFSIAKFQADENGSLEIIGLGSGGQQTITGVEQVIANTGARPNIEMHREVRMELDSALESVADIAPLIDPNVHSCGTIRPHGAEELMHPEPGFFIVGMKSYGRAPTFLMTTGYEQVRSIFAALVGDMERARDVQLNLPETGVCSSNIPGVVCCEGGKDTPVNEFAVAPDNVSAPDLKMKKASGCGCGCA